MATTTVNCNDVFAFLQAVTVKSPRVTVAPLSLRAEKRARVWFRRCSKTNLTMPPKMVPKDHTGLTGVLTDVATRLQSTEALRPVAAVQREAEKETKGRDCLPPTYQLVILEAIATNGTSILTSPPPTLHLS